MAEEVEKELASLKDKYNTLHKEHTTLQDECILLKHRLSALTTETSEQSNHDHSEEFWDDIHDKVKSNPDYVKSLVRNGTISMTDMDKTKRTLLVIAAAFGSYDIVQLCLNLGAEIDHKSARGHSAMDYARGEGYYHIAQLLQFSKMKTQLGSKVKVASDHIMKQQAIIGYIMNELSQIGSQTKDLFENTLLELMNTLILKRAVFSDDLLNLCWDITCKTHANPLESELYRTLSSVCTKAIRNGSATDWYWIKNCIVPSTIWYRRIDIETEEKAKGDQDQNVRYLFYKLLDIVDFESKNNLAKLQQDLNELANENPDEWKQLTQWDLSKSANVPRQDCVVRGIESRYTYTQLLLYVGAKFDAFKWNEVTQYLGELILLAQMVDDAFQSSVKTLFNVNGITGFGTVDSTDDAKANADEHTLVGKVKYIRGPVKLIERCISKTEDKYSDRTYPTSACLLDLNRCGLIFYDMQTLLDALNTFERTVKAQQAGNIIDIVRDKNLFKAYVQETQYADIKLNVLIQGQTHNIVGEVQFLLQIMADFKAKEHNLYSIQRNREYLDNCVSKILPSLLNEDDQIFTAGSRGSVKDLCRLLVYNKSIKDIMKQDKGHQTILFTICSQGHNNAYRLLKSMIAKGDFIEYVFTSNLWDTQPMDYAIRFGNTVIVNDVLSMQEVQHKYQNDTKMLYRLLYWLFVYCKNRRLIDDVLRRLDVSKSKLIECLAYVYPQPTQTFHEWAHHYHRTNIIGRTIRFNTVDGLKMLISKIGEEAFVNQIFRTDDYDKNGIEYAISEDRLEIIEFVMKIEPIKQKCINDKDALYRIVKQMDKRYNQNAAQLMVKALELNETKLKQLNAYKQISADTIHKILNS
eukprot:298291_1